jgi:hypothetical protein
MNEPATYPIMSQGPVPRARPIKRAAHVKKQVSSQNMDVAGDTSVSSTSHEPQKESSGTQPAPSAVKPAKTRKRAATTPEPVEARRELTVEDLEFDYDRSKLSDLRATPGRKARPRMDEHDLRMSNHPLAELLPPSPDKKLKRKRISRLEKDRLYKQSSKEEPRALFS